MKACRDSLFHGLNVNGFIQASDDPKSFENEILQSKKLATKMK